jgi:hypothetical protein
MTDTNDNNDPPTVSLEHPEEIDWMTKGWQRASVSAVKAQLEFTVQTTKELLHTGARKGDPSDADIAAAHSNFRGAVNMAATTTTDDWAAEEVADARIVADFITRLRDTFRGDPVSEDCSPARDVTLMNWGYKPNSTEVRSQDVTLGVPCSPVPLTARGQRRFEEYGVR